MKKHHPAVSRQLKGAFLTSSSAKKIFTGIARSVQPGDAHFYFATGLFYILDDFVLDGQMDGLYYIGSTCLVLCSTTSHSQHIYKTYDQQKWYPIGFEPLCDLGVDDLQEIQTNSLIFSEEVA